ncbi:MAG: AraC family transcriptional regulator [Anaerolineae bacterium]
MKIQIEERQSDSPFVERIWRSQTGEPGEFISIATSHWELVVWQENGTSNIALRGPETTATCAPVPADSVSFGVIFKLGTVMPHLPVRQLVDNQINLPVVDAVLRGHPQELSIRTVQRRFLQATGITHNAVHQIERARHATLLLESGLSILDTVDQAGYYDQPHLTRSLKRYIGQTPTQIQGKKDAQPLSFLYKTSFLKHVMMDLFDHHTREKGVST